MKINKISRRAFLLGQRILLFCRIRLCCIRQCRSCGQ